MKAKNVATILAGIVLGACLVFPIWVASFPLKLIASIGIFIIIALYVIQDISKKEKN